MIIWKQLCLLHKKRKQSLISYKSYYSEYLITKNDVKIGYAIDKMRVAEFIMRVLE